MQIKNIKDFVNDENENIFSCDILNDNGSIEHVELPQYIVKDNKVVLNPKVVDYKEQAAKQRVVSKLANKVGLSKENNIKKEERVVKPAVEPTEIKQEAKNPEQVNKNKFKRIVGRIALFIGVGVGAFMIGSFKGCGSEKNIIGNDTKKASTDTKTDDNSNYIKDDVISVGDAIADIKAIELELIKYGILDKNSPAYDEILDGARALYARVNAEELSPETLKALGFSDLDAIQIIGKSFDVTGELLTNAYGRSQKGEQDYLHLSIFCHNTKDKQIADQLHDIATQSLTTDSKDVADKNVDTIGNYYRNLSPVEFKYSVGVGESIDPVLNLYAEEIIKMGGKLGVSEEKIDSIVDLPGYGNYSYEYRILERKCQYDETDLSKTK